MAKKQLSKNQNLKKSKSPHFKPLMAYHMFIVDNLSEDGECVNMEVLGASKEENGVSHEAVALVLNSGNKQLK